MNVPFHIRTSTPVCYILYDLLSQYIDTYDLSPRTGEILSCPEAIDCDKQHCTRPHFLIQRSLLPWFLIALLVTLFLAKSRTRIHRRVAWKLEVESWLVLLRRTSSRKFCFVRFESGAIFTL